MCASCAGRGVLQTVCGRVRLGDGVRLLLRRITLVMVLIIGISMIADDGMVRSVVGGALLALFVARVER